MPARSGAKAPDALWTARPVGTVSDFSQFEVLEGGQPRGTVHWPMLGAHNMENALAAIAAARHAGVAVEHSIAALESFEGIAFGVLFQITFSPSEPRAGA